MPNESLNNSWQRVAARARCRRVYETCRGREPDDEGEQTMNELSFQAVPNINHDIAKGQARVVDVASQPSGDGDNDAGCNAQPSRTVLGGLQLSASLWGIETAEWHGEGAD